VRNCRNIRGPGVALISLMLVSVTPVFDVKPLRGILRATSKLTLRVTIRGRS
jgi:hypothetical protein